MEGKPAPDDGVVAFDQRTQNGRRQRRRALDATAARPLSLASRRRSRICPAHCSLSMSIRALSSRKMMGVAQRVPDAGGHRVIGLEMIVDDDAAAKALGQIAAFGRHPIRGQGRGRGGMQPLALAGDAKAGFVEVAHRGLGHERGDPRRDRLELLGLPAPQATTLSGQSLAAPNRSAIACATRSSGMSCCTLR